MCAIGLAVLLLAAPVLFAAGVVSGEPGPPATAVAVGLVAAVGGGKLAAVVWGLASRFLARTELRRAAASLD
jgi:hypothetical protein